MNIEKMSDEELLAYKEKLEAKIKFHTVNEQTLKILMNSSYGSTALPINNFSFGKGMSESITTTGRVANRYVAYKVNEYMNSTYNLNIDVDKCPLTIQADTDSNYFCFEKMVQGDTREEKTTFLQKQLDAIISKKIEESIKEIAYCFNAMVPDVLYMEQEKVCDVFISTADKRYVGRYYKDGKPKYKITGLSLVGKSTPKFCKEKLEPIIDIIMDQDASAIVEYVEKVRKEFQQAPIEDICVIKSMSSLDYSQGANGKFYKNGDSSSNSAPIHSRGAIIHNKIIDNKKLKFPKIVDKDKVFYAYLKQPNIEAYNQNVISFINPKFLEEANLLHLIDYDTLFEKNFEKNVKIITDAINISLDKYVGQMDLWC
jgi:hypothetical protein